MSCTNVFITSNEDFDQEAEIIMARHMIVICVYGREVENICVYGREVVSSIKQATKWSARMPSSTTFPRDIDFSVNRVDLI